MNMYVAFAAGAAVAMAAGTANAATVIFNPDVFGAPTGYTLFDDFNDATGQSLVSGSKYFFPTGNVPGQAASLPGNDTPYLVVRGGGVANVSFGSDVRSFSFDYSTVDTYNTLTINYADGGSEKVTGGQILTSGKGSGSVSGSFIINGDGRLISGLALATSSNSFEVDNLAISDTLAAVPEPATWALMIVGFGMVGTGMRRRSMAAVVA